MTAEDVHRSRAQLEALLSSFEQGNSLKALAKEQALNTLVQLSPSGSLMKTVGQDTIAQNCPEEVSNKADREQMLSRLNSTKPKLCMYAPSIVE